jgi:nitrogen regulatory protein P-II 1
MKSIVAVVHGEELGPVQTSLYALGVEQMTLSQVLVRAKGHTLIYRSAKIQVPFESRLRLEMVVDDHQADAVIAELIRVAFIGETDPLGTGRIVVRPCAEVHFGETALLASSL